MEFMTSLQNGLDEQKPSLFELLSEQQLAGLIPPSLRYLLAVATHRRPRYLLRVLNSFDELYALLMLAVERHYLRAYGGGFTENFYGLKRERVLNIKGGEAPRASRGAPALMREALRLKEKDVWKNLAIMVGIPYLKRKLDESYDIHVPAASILGPQYNRNTLPPNATMKERISYYYKWFLRDIYPSVNAAYYFFLLAFNLAYLFDNTKYFSPFLWLIGTRIRRMAQADYRAIALAEQASSMPPSRPGARPGQTNSVWNPTTFTTIIYPRLLSSLRLLLPTSIFALKFLEWWHASDFARQLSRKAAEGLDLPPPIVSGMPVKQHPPPSPGNAKPRSLSKSPTNTVSLSTPAPQPPQTASPSSPFHPASANPQPSKPTPPLSSTSHLPILTVPPPTAQTSSLCPICLGAIQTPTSAQTGYVFCYTCIFKWVDGRHERQEAFMANGGGEERWGEEEDDDDGFGLDGEEEEGEKRSSREGKWEDGRGRCAVTGRRVLGGTEGLRRIMI
ncbi:MAG: hypothetical protein L6R40_004211 [Gallowayella cf. fulva]|nr:MAG: hypothetical protein L6R40_004211 [Xanthomendoza cf. fulva]